MLLSSSSPSRRHRLALVLVATASLAAACGSDDESSSTESTAAQQPTSSAAPSTTAASTTTVPTTAADATTTTSPDTTAPETTEPATTAAPTTEEPTTTAAPPTVAPTTTAAPTTTVAAGPTADTVVVAGAFGAIGLWDGAAGLWRDDIEFDPATIPVAAGDTFTLFSLDGAVGSATATEVGPTCEPTDSYGPYLDPEMTFEFDFDRDVINPIATNASFDIQPRAAEVLDALSPRWVPQVQQQLTELGIPAAPVSVVQAVQADLEGDGVNEVVVIAENPPITDGMMAWDIGAYTMVLVLRQDGGEEVVSVLESLVVTEEPTFPNYQYFELNSFADLNGDGTMEVIVDYIVWEGAGTFVYEVIQGVDPERVMAGGCGS